MASLICLSVPAVAGTGLRHSLHSLRMGATGRHEIEGDTVEVNVRQESLAGAAHLAAGRGTAGQLACSRNGFISGNPEALQRLGLNTGPRLGRNTAGSIIAAASGAAAGGGGRARVGGSAKIGTRSGGRNVISGVGPGAGGRGKRMEQGSEMEGEALEKDFVSRILSQAPSRVEPKFLIDGRMYTMREAQEKYAPLLQKLTNVGKMIDSSVERIRAQLGRLAATSDGERLRVQEIKGAEGNAQITGKGGVQQGMARVGTAGRTSSIRAGLEETAPPLNGAQAEGSESGGSEAVYLKDLLREYRGNLYVPEEAFEKSVPDMKEFERALVEAPRISLTDFKRYAATDQVAALVSRGKPTFRGEYKYYDFLVELKEAPGEPALQRTTWAMLLDSETAKSLLQSYTGPQREVETSITAYVEMPQAAPHPVAATISSRVYVEAAAFASLVATALKLAWGAGAAVFGATAGVFTFVALYILVPLSKPFVLPFYWLGLALFRGAWSLLLGLAYAVARACQVAILEVASTTAAVSELGFRGVALLFTDAGRFMASRVLNSALRTLFAIIFVIAVMAALAKFTLTRRTRDFTKWDIWQAIEFGQSKPQARVEGSTGVRFEDVAGINEVVRELQELVAYLKDPQSFNTMGTMPPHGVLLEGPPGCGKTLLAKAIAGEAGVPFYQMAGSEFVEVLVGVGAARVRDLFKRAKVNRPSVVFIDEIDALGAARSNSGGMAAAEGYDEGTQERETTLNQLLIELDGFDAGQGVIFLGATNRMDMLDPALMRPGRFDRKIAIRPPNTQGRLEVLQVHARSVKLAPSVDLWTIAKNLPGWSGAQMAQLLQEGAIMAAQRRALAIEQRDLDKALDRITLGVARGGQKDSEAGEVQKPTLLRRIAAHDLGLAMSALLLRKLEGAQIEPPQRLSVVPRGETLSRVLFDHVDDEWYMFESRSTLLQRLKVFLSGRAAEEVLYGRDTSTYSLLHLPDASWMAYKLVSIWNMGEKVALRGVSSPWRRSSGFSGPPVAFEGTLYDDYGFSDFRLGGETDDEIARMAKDLLDQTYAEIYTLLEEYKTALTKSIYVLLEAGELYAEDLEVLVEAYPPGTPLEAVESEEEPGEIPAWAQPMAVEAGTTKQEEEEGALEAGDGSALMLPAGIVSSEASLVEAEGGKIQAKDERQEEVEEGELEKSESVYSESEREPVQEEEGEREALFDGTDERDQEGSAVGATEMGEGKASLEEVGSSTIPEEHEEEWLSSSDVRNASDAAEDVDEGETRASDYVNNASQMMDADDRRLEPRGSGAPQVNGEPRIREGLPLNGTEAFGATESSEAEEQEAGGLSETTPSESPRRQGGGANEEANGASKLAADSPPAQPEPVASIRGAAENRTE